MQDLLNFCQSIRQKSAFFAAVGGARISAVDTRQIAPAPEALSCLPSAWRALRESRQLFRGCSYTRPGRFWQVIPGDSATVVTCVSTWKTRHFLGLVRLRDL